MLEEWLNWEPQSPNSYAKFSVIHVDHIDELPEQIRSFLTELLIRARFSEKFLERVNRRLGWDEKRIREQLILPKIPLGVKAKRGEFGEVLLCALLEQFAGYEIPVPKLQFKLTSGQSLPSTDALAIKFDDNGAVAEVCFVESKLRTTDDGSAAVQAANQLMLDTSKSMPDILRFVAEVLDMKDSPVADAFIDYLGDRADTSDKETYCIGLCWERNVWSGNALSNLEDADLAIERLNVSVVRILDLGILTDELFSAVGITELDDDD